MRKWGEIKGEETNTLQKKKVQWPKEESLL